MNDDDRRQWQRTDLWSLLEKARGNDHCEVKATLERWMPRVEAILAKGGTASTDFTLHDDGHAFRVAQRMCDVIPESVRESLSLYELALLLLSAYLHDIGMTPEQSKIIGHRDYLMTGDKTRLNGADVRGFQNWLDSQQDGLEPPITLELAL